jgi:hypothetical protein
MVSGPLKYLDPSTFTELFLIATDYGGWCWQTSQDKKQLNQIGSVIYKESLGTLIIQCKELIDINIENTLFVKLNYRSLIFRLDPGQYLCNGTFIICSLPKMVMGLDKRLGGDRFVMPGPADVSLSLKKMERYFGEITFQLELRVIDVSEQGIGIMVTSLNKHILKHHDRFNIYSIDNRPLDRPIAGVICYVQSKGEGMKRGDVRMGLKLNSRFDSETFSYLKKKGQRILLA